jgi:hypothetical protein
MTKPDLHDLFLNLAKDKDISCAAYWEGSSSFRINSFDAKPLH